jgi:NAD(P)-dependent dehydrogenase (short-subunit alcohol dehydrogenase family)
MSPTVASSGKTNKVAVVLGASSQGGTGWATAELFAEQDANDVVGARSQAGIEELAEQIGGMAFRCDASVEDDVSAMADAAEAAYGKIDIAVIAAGAPIVASIDACDKTKLQEATVINFFGPFYLIKHMARHMADHGAIVFNSSMSAERPCPGYVAYACAKGACGTLVKNAALEYAPRGIRVNIVIAGVILSPMNAPLRANTEAWKAILKEIPLGRDVEPLQIAHTCLWLSSAHCAITGESIIFDIGNHVLRATQPYELSEHLLQDNASQTGYSS